MQVSAFNNAQRQSSTNMRSSRNNDSDEVIKKDSGEQKVKVPQTMSKIASVDSRRAQANFSSKKKSTMEKNSSVNKNWQNRKVHNADIETSLNMFNVRDRAATKVSNPLHLNLSALHTDTIDRVSATSRNQ